MNKELQYDKLHTNPLAGGEQSANHTRQSCYEDYLTSEFCLSCAYFQQTKGHFGFCKVKPSLPYDGSKKDSGCLCWRINNDLIGIEKIERDVKPELIKPNKIIMESVKRLALQLRSNKLEIVS